MQPFTLLQGVAAPIDEANIDTDQLAPARFLRRPRDKGYGDILFHDLRFSAPDVERSEFVLNQKPYRNARILVADENFGGGSSREQAVWALMDYGIRCVIAASFGDIFYNNSVNHGLLLVRLEPGVLVGLRNALHARPGAMMTVDLAQQKITGPGGEVLCFDIEASRKRRLLSGLDSIGLTLQHRPEIERFEAAYRDRKHWLFRPQTAV
jgi:3-isopropylmalate/(R)-2-methylmalate dehydratase small subunit